MAPLRTSNGRTFPNMTVPAMARQVFADHGFSRFDLSRLTGRFRTRGACVQYREADFTFDCDD
jgi:uncharacterized protein involved in type VI secretion and phage assembly